MVALHSLPAGPFAHLLGALTQLHMARFWDARLFLAPTLADVRLQPSIFIGKWGDLGARHRTMAQRDVHLGCSPRYPCADGPIAGDKVALYAGLRPQRILQCSLPAQAGSVASPWVQTLDLGVFRGSGSGGRGAGKGARTS